MKRIFIFAIALSLILTGLTGCTSSDDAQADAALDEAIHEVEHVFSEFYFLSADASVSDIQSVAGELAEAWAAVRSAAEGSDADISEAAAAYEDLSATVAALEPEQQGAMQVVVPKMEVFKESIDTLHESGGFHE